MGIGAVGLVIVFFVVSRMVQKFSEAMKAPPRQRLPGDAPQTMAELMLEMRQQLEKAQERQEARRLPPSPTSHPTGSAESVRIARAAGRSVVKRLPTEVAERGGSIEVASRDETVVEIDRDDDAEALVQRRIEAAQARNREWQASDHTRFDQQIRQVAPVAAPAKPRSALQRAMIWREVLGPPVGLRADDER